MSRHSSNTPGAADPASWLDVSPQPGPVHRRYRRWVWLGLALYLVATWFGVEHGIGSSWRECDTQAIARNFLADGFDPLRPRVDWRGDTDGAVECEFPLYQMAIAGALALFGDVEWPGRALSALAMAIAALSLHRLLEWRAGPAGALAGTAVFLCGGHAFLLACRVMPDALSLCFALAGLLTYARYLATGRGTALWLSVAATGFAVMQKPTALQLGLVMLGWTALLAPRRLREPRLWIGGLLVLALVGSWLAHGRTLHAETGLSFGVVSGGDTKFPSLENLLDPGIHLQLAKTTAMFGFTVFAAVALVALLTRRRFDRGDLAVVGTALVGLLVSLRYSYHHGMGPHYHVFAAVAGAWCVARAWPAKAPSWLWAALLAGVAVHGAWRLRDERGKAIVCHESAILDVAAFVHQITQPGERIIVRSDKPAFDPQWRRANNFEDPRLLYAANRRGWVLPADGMDVAALVALRGKGARILYYPLPGEPAPEVAAWLARYAEVLLRTPDAMVYRLQSVL